MSCSAGFSSILGSPCNHTFTFMVLPSGLLEHSFEESDPALGLSSNLWASYWPIFSLANKKLCNIASIPEVVMYGRDCWESDNEHN